MTEAELVAAYPRLWHMAEDGSWPSIRDHGLLSTAALCDRYGVGEAERVALLSQRRPMSVALARDGLPPAVVRDQKPMSDAALARCLDPDVTPAEWYAILNDKVFFWLSRPRLQRLLSAQAYRDQPQTVITLRTSTLVAAHRDRILLSPINSGSTIMRPQPRGWGTFLPIGEYPFTEWRRKRGASEAVVELVVSGGVPDIADHAVAVHRVADGVAKALWRTPAEEETLLEDDNPFGPTGVPVSGSS